MMAEEEARESPASLLWPQRPAERWQFAACGSEATLSSYQISMWTLKSHIKTGCNCMFVVKLPIQLRKRGDPWLEGEKSASQGPPPPPQVHSSSSPRHVCQDRAGQQIGPPLSPPGSGGRTPAAPRWPRCHGAPGTERPVPAGSSGTWQWARAAISKGHYPAHRPGGLILG